MFGIIYKRGDIINRPIELGHPADIVFKVKVLNQRQQGILDRLPGYGANTLVRKRDVSMNDLSAMTAKTGDEFAMFTRKGERLIVRGDAESIPLLKKDIIKLRDEGYRWSGHTHPGIMDADLIASDGDKTALFLFNQNKSAIYNAIGKHSIVQEVGNNVES